MHELVNYPRSRGDPARGPPGAQQSVPGAFVEAGTVTSTENCWSMLDGVFGKNIQIVATILIHNVHHNGIRDLHFSNAGRGNQDA